MISPTLATYTAVTLAVAVALAALRCGRVRLGPLDRVVSAEAGGGTWVAAKVAPAFLVTLAAPGTVGLTLLRATLFEATLAASRRCRVLRPDVAALREFALGLALTATAVAVAVYIRA